MKKKQHRLSKDDRQQQILQAALPVFALHGLAGTTTKMLAKAADITEPVLYQHFSSKEELYKSLETFCLMNIRKSVAVLETLHSGTERLVYGIYFFTRTVLWAIPGKNSKNDLNDTKNITRLYLQSLLTDEANIARVNIENLKVFVGLLLEAWKQAIKENSVQKDVSASEAELWLFIQMVVGVGAYWLPEPAMTPVQLRREELVIKNTRMFLLGLGLKANKIEQYLKKEISQIMAKKLEDCDDCLDID